jgi:hypothetical protein
MQRRKNAIGKHIVACRVVRVTKITGSGSDDCIYWHFGYSLL